MARGSKSAATIRRRHYTSPALREVLLRHKVASTKDSLDSDDEEIEYFHQDIFIQSSLLRQLLSSQRTLFLSLLAFRCVNAMIVQTSYVPDEYWQSTEVAHRIVFGYGYLTWEWRVGIRSYVYPAVIAFLYKTLAVLHLDYRILLIKLPRLLHALFAAISDLYVYKLSYKLSGHQVAVWSLLCQLTSWFTFYCSTRTLTNSIETMLTAVALFYFPWPNKPRKAHWKFISLVGLSVVIRPTAIIVWIPLGVWYILLWRHVAWKVIRMVAERGFLILSLSSIVDRVFYGKWVHVHYNFLQFNVLTNMATFYGSHPWHWYISQGFVVIVGAQIVPFVLALKKGMQPGFLFLIGWTIFVYSLLSHKEFRFLFPILPFVMHVAGEYLHYLTSDSWSEIQTRLLSASQGASNNQAGVQSENESTRYNGQRLNSKTTQETHHSKLQQITIRMKYWLDYLCLLFEYRCKQLWSSRTCVIVALIATNLPLALYTSILHQRGTLDVMNYISNQVNNKLDGQSISVMYLMPCHSTPYYSFVHSNVTMRFLTCEPNIENSANYTDEADLFYAEPQQWLKEEMDKLEENRSAFVNNELPTHLVMFNVLQPQIKTFLKANHYEPCARFFHTHFPEGRVGSHVIVFCLEKWAKLKRHDSKRSMNANKF